jgi:hypothetical protein
MGCRARRRSRQAFGQFQASPDYQFAQSEGMRALENSNAAKGLLQSSGHLRSAQEFGQNLASQQYGNYVNRLTGLANQGLSATGTGVAANLNARQSARQHQHELRAEPRHRSDERRQCPVEHLRDELWRPVESQLRSRARAAPA